MQQHLLAWGRQLSARGLAVPHLTSQLLFQLPAQEQLCSLGVKRRRNI